MPLHTAAPEAPGDDALTGWSPGEMPPSVPPPTPRSKRKFPKFPPATITRKTKFLWRICSIFHGTLNIYNSRSLASNEAVVEEAEDRIIIEAEDRIIIEAENIREGS
jgi:hypothetical protein